MSKIKHFNAKRGSCVDDVVIACDVSLLHSHRRIVTDKSNASSISGCAQIIFTRFSFHGGTESVDEV